VTDASAGVDAAAGDAVRYEVAGGVATLTLNRPGNHNALSTEMVAGLRASLDRALADDGVRVVVLTNEGTTFCAGADLRSNGGQNGAPNLFPSILGDMMDAPKPIVGRLNGGCFGGGVGLAAACDISIAPERIRIGFTEVRIGVAPAIISVVCLPKMRRSDALELFLTGERITARRAAEVGLINHVVPDDDLDRAVAELVGKLVLGGPLALAASKDFIKRVPAMTRDDAFAWTAERSAALFASDEAAEGIGAFREKRTASWVPSAD
jgi:methylglutaconyl-CoA hydratase